MSDIREQDKIVLDYIFDPNISGSYDFQNAELNDIPNNDQNTVITEDVLNAKQFEVEGIKQAEEGNLKDAIELFTKSISIVETPSSYNNRAQAYRLMFQDKKALDDLEKAIVISKGHGRSACQALCQRALLWRKLGQDDKAREDFKGASSLGSNFAKKQLTDMNPYAAMCNQMLHQMMTQCTRLED